MRHEGNANLEIGVFFFLNQGIIRQRFRKSMVYVKISEYEYGNIAVICKF